MDCKWLDYFSNACMSCRIFINNTCYSCLCIKEFFRIKMDKIIFKINNITRKIKCDDAQNRQ